MRMFYKNFDDRDEFANWVHENWPERYNSFSDEGWKAIFDDIQEILGEETEDEEVDIVALCGSYTEYDTKAELKDGGFTPDDFDVKELPNGHYFVRQ